MIGRGLPLALFVVAVVLFMSGYGRAAPFERRVLGLYSSAEGKTEIYNPLRANIEMVLNHLGLKLEYHDIERGLPEASMAERYRGFVVWLDGSEARNPDAFWTWVKLQVDARRRMVFLSGISPTIDSETGGETRLGTINDALSGLGVRLGSVQGDLALDIELIHKDSTVVEFERKLRNELTRFDELHSIDPENEVFLKLRLKSSGTESDVVVVSESGGVVMPGYLMYADPVTDKRQWRVNPFTFLSRALGVTDTPRPDVTTLSGTRVFYTHIDGDGISNLSYATRKASGRIVLEEILKGYSDLPFTVSVISVEVDPMLRGSTEGIAAARAAFRLPNVEAASHTYSHPLVWSSELETEDAMLAYEDVIGDLVVSGRAVLPWRIEGYTFDPAAETSLACQQVEDDLLPPGKTCRLLLWSGNCLPDEETLRACADAGILNLNGGDARFDGAYPSYAYVTPLYRKAGDYYQIHSSNSNENTYTELWTERFGAFQNVIQTFENTGHPRRVSAINVYYHFYAAERPAGLHALKRVFDWVREQKTFPVFASRYAEMVNGFIQTKVDHLGPDRWQITDNGACRTIRFDADLHVDIEKSSGVLGYQRDKKAVYVTLDESGDHTIELSKRPSKSFHLRESTADVSRFVLRESGQFSFHTDPYGPSRFVWKNAGVSRSFTVTADNGKDSPQQTRVTSDSEGRLLIQLAKTGPVTVRVVPTVPTPGSSS